MAPLKLVRAKERARLVRLVRLRTTEKEKERVPPPLKTPPSSMLQAKAREPRTPAILTTARTTAKMLARTQATSPSASTSSSSKLRQPSRVVQRDRSRTALPDRSNRMPLVDSSRASDSVTFSEEVLLPTPRRPTTKPPELLVAST
jgi:hypothetical protein